MKYYTETISPALAKKLKDKGMPMEVWNGTIQGIPYISVMEKSSFDWLDKELGNTPSEIEAKYSIPTFASCFDWLMENGYQILLFVNNDGRNFGVDAEVWSMKIGFTKLERKDTWHEAAEAAIEKALTLI